MKQIPYVHNKTKLVMFCSLFICFSIACVILKIILHPAIRNTKCWFKTIVIRLWGGNVIKMTSVVICCHFFPHYQGNGKFFPSRCLQTRLLLALRRQERIRGRGKRLHVTQVSSLVFYTVLKLENSLVFKNWAVT